MIKSMSQLKLRKTKAILIPGLIISGLAVQQGVIADEETVFYATSPNVVDNIPVPAEQQAVLEADDAPLITFSEFPVNTHITNQYSDQGIVFAGDNPFISTDGANPTSPVLSGTPRFEGAIEGHFVNPEKPEEGAIVESFTLDAGYFDAFGSTRIRWFDKDGNVLGQRTNTQFGIETFTISGGNIASWRTEIIEDEPAGYAVDNVTFQSVISSILFREKSGDDKDGTWGFFVDEIPGFDHVGFNYQGTVYESHPGYPTGTYVSEDGSESLLIPEQDAVQAVHSRATFEHDAQLPGQENSPVIDFVEIPIDSELADKMQEKVENMIAAGATFQFINFSSIDGIEATLSPAAQKGGSNTYTCIGMVEAAAELANHNGGQGFIKNFLESFTVSYPVVDEIVIGPITIPYIRIETRELPMLSPQLLFFVLQGSATREDIKGWFQGLFDPVDFIITDPLGRRLGYTEELGELLEIPGAFFSGNGKLEQFLILNPVPGKYQIQFFGLGEHVFGGMADQDTYQTINDDLADMETIESEYIVVVFAGAPGDVDGDADLDNDDRGLILGLLNTFPNSLDHPADINRDGIINDADLIWFDELVANQPEPQEGDLNSDSKVDENDFTHLLAAFGSCEGDNRYLAKANYDDSDMCITLVDYQAWHKLLNP
ncbi:conserved hypothetical protein, secreted [Candidatus Thiomargarita nelsonii]|uniref:Dockerin domain-containing protein n=1 Tax=Candidatus Thiomargarita nelsonii TaxID=1003181 RepID=A0A176S1L3_9GAMM|nr:conserved hypothetical protein, secreted [Candidatus Thiomargarita nelsonii]